MLDNVYLSMLTRTVTSSDHAEPPTAHAQRMQALARLASWVAHDFNNICAAIGGYTNLIMAEFDESAVVRDDLKEIRNATNRATHLIGNLLGFAHNSVSYSCECNLHHLFSERSHYLRQLLGPAIELELLAAPDPWLVGADP